MCSITSISVEFMKFTKDLNSFSRCLFFYSAPLWTICQWLMGGFSEIITTNITEEIAARILRNPSNVIITKRQ